MCRQIGGAPTLAERGCVRTTLDKEVAEGLTLLLSESGCCHGRIVSERRDADAAGATGVGPLPWWRRERGTAGRSGTDLSDHDGDVVMATAGQGEVR